MRSLVTRGLSGVLLASAAGCSVFEAPLPDASIDDGAVGADDASTDAAVVSPVDANMIADVGVDAIADAGTDSAGADGSTPATDDGAVETDAGTDAAEPSCVLTGVDVMDVCSGDVVINEVDGSGDDFVEIYNRGDVAVNISGWVIADDSGGSPDVSEGAIVPNGTVLEAKRFLYVWANLSPEPGGNPGLLFDTCIPGAPPPCLHTEWGVSASGERLYLLNGSLTLVCAVNYPNAVFGGEAFGRIPDGSSQLCPTKPTPGESNVRSTLR